MKKWFKKNKGYVTTIGLSIVGITIGFVSYKGIVKMVDISRKNMLRIVENNLKMANDGDFIDILVGNRTDDYSRIKTSKRWTKHNGEILYLGKVREVIELSDDEKIAKQLDKIGKSINTAVQQIINK